MNFNDYQERAADTCLPPNMEVLERLTPRQLLDVARFCAGVAGEAGELNEAWKKFLRGDYSPTEFVYRIRTEAGDCLWYLSQLLDTMGISFESVALQNLEKLARRKTESTLQGDGENR